MSDQADIAAQRLIRPMARKVLSLRTSCLQFVEQFPTTDVIPNDATLIDDQTPRKGPGPFAGSAAHTLKTAVEAVLAAINTTAVSAAAAQISDGGIGD